MRIFSTQKISKSIYQVDIIDEERFALLKDNFPGYTISNRVSAALAGDSHKHSVSQAMIILWVNQHSHPVVILNDGNGITTPVTLGGRLLIIENQENFVQKAQTLTFLNQQFPDFNDIALDIETVKVSKIQRASKAIFSNIF
ncbi:MAG: hypothetical protein Q7U57_19015 [Methylovulum sp.]|nr:hypothetical protein [Methylovulum sp.]